MGKVVAELLPRPPREEKVFEMPVKGTDQVVKLRLRRMNKLDMANLQSFVQSAHQRLDGTVVLDEDVIQVSENTAMILTALVMTQQGDPDDIYTEEELLKLMAADDNLVEPIAEAAMWTMPEEDPLPPAEPSLPNSAGSESSTPASGQESDTLP